MCGLALLTVAARIAMRFFTRRKLFLDDYFLIVAMPCVVVATSMLQWGADGLFLYKAVISDVPFVLDAADLNELTHVTIVTNVFVDTSWTAIFCVKFSFLALFRVLIKNVSTHLSRYFWCVVVITAVTWAFLVSEAFILCSKFGWASCKQFCIIFPSQPMPTNSSRMHRSRLQALHAINRRRHRAGHHNRRPR